MNYYLSFISDAGVAIIKVPIKIDIKVNDDFTKVMAVSLAKPNNLI